MLLEHMITDNGVLKASNSKDFKKKIFLLSEKFNYI